MTHSLIFLFQTVELTYPTDEFDMYTIAQLSMSLSATVFIIGLIVWIFKSDTSSKRKGVSAAAADWEVDELSVSGKKKK